jgi:hypothetical protein
MNGPTHMPIPWPITSKLASVVLRRMPTKRASEQNRLQYMNPVKLRVMSSA